MMEVEEALSDCEFTLDISEEEADVLEEVVLPVDETVRITDKSGDSRKSKDPILRVVEDVDENTTNSANSLDIDLNDRAHLITETLVTDDFDNVNEFDQKLADDAVCRLKKNSAAGDSVIGNLKNHLNSESRESEYDEKKTIKDRRESCSLVSASPHKDNGVNSIDAVCERLDGNLKNDCRPAQVDSKLLASNLPDKEVGSVRNATSIILTNGNVEYSVMNAVPNGAMPISHVSVILSKKNGSILRGHEIRDKSADSRARIADLLKNNGSLVDSSVPDGDGNFCSGSKKRKLEIPSNSDSRPNSSASNHLIEKCTKIDEPARNNGVSFSNADAVAGGKFSCITKKNIARKHTSSTSTSKVLKDLESTVRKEMKKYGEKSISNGNLASDFDGMSSNDARDSMDGKVHERATNARELFKVSLPIDAFGDTSLKNIFKTMRKTLSRRQLEEIVLQKVCEMISDSSEIGELKKQVIELQQAETHRKQTCFNLEKQLHQLKGVCQVFLEKVKNVKDDNRLITPTVITRSVGLQVAVDSNPFVQNNVDCYPTKSNTAPPLSSSCSPRTLLSPSSSPTPPSKPTDCKSSFTSCTNEVNSSSLPTSIVDSVSGMRSPETTSLLETSNPTSSKASSKSTISVDTDSGDTAIIDLTEKDDKIEDPLSVSTSNMLSSDQSSKPVTTSVAVNNPATGITSGTKTNTIRPMTRHPAPLPPTPSFTIRPGMLLPPPRPDLRIFRNKDGISLSWNMPLNQHNAKISRYQIYAYQETTAALTGDPWKPVGDVNALPLPMECTLTQFFSGYRYHFTVRAIDEHVRIGPFSTACSIAL